MYITVPMRKQKNKQYQKKHQQSIFKEIQYNSIFQKISQQDQLKKSNGFTSIKQRLIKENEDNPLFRNSCSTTFRRGSQSLGKFTRHRPSVSSILSTKDKKQQFFKTTGDFFDRKRFVQNDNFIIQQKPDQRESQDKHQQTLQLSQKTVEKQNSSQSIYQTVFNFKPKKILKPKRKNVTLLDLKIQNIEQIIKKSGKGSNVQDFVTFAQKDQNMTKTKCWKNFYNQMMKNSSKKSGNIQENIQKLRRTATSHHKRKILEPQNSVQKIFLQKKKIKFFPQSQCVSPKQTPRKNSLQSNLLVQPTSPCALEQQNMWQFFNFVKGSQKIDQYSKKKINAKVLHIKKQLRGYKTKFIIQKNYDVELQELQARLDFIICLFKLKSLQIKIQKKRNIHERSSSMTTVRDILYLINLSQPY